MNDTARRLRVQKEYSTDPAYLERMAREEEIRGVDPTIEGGSTPGLLLVPTRHRAEGHEAVQVVLSAPAERRASPIWWRKLAHAAPQLPQPSGKARPVAISVPTATRWS